MKRIAIGILVIAGGLVSCALLPRNAPSSGRTPAAAADDGTPKLRKGFVDLKSLDPAKKTVCAITLNSENEILSFQKNLSRKEFQFVELFSPQENWLTHACQSGVKCDVLVVSGHFGGSFFGKSGRMDLTELEGATCGRTCSGIFHQPKEVFLFGCNTLAGKEKDSRSPEEYRQTLINDGFNRAQADQIVALRYSPIGQTFEDRMSRVFAGVPRIYGFSTIGPSGDTVEPLLQDYFDNRGVYHEYLNSVMTSADAVKKNGILSWALKITALKQKQGATMGQNDQLPMCFVRSRDIPDSNKIRWLHRVLKDKDQRLLYLGEIKYFLEQSRSGSARALEMRLFGEITADKELRESMRTLIAKGLEAYPGLRLDALVIAEYFGWVTLPEGKKYREDFWKRFLKNGMGIEDADMVCSYPQIGALITDDDLKDISFGQSQVLRALRCLKTADAGIQRRLWETLDRSRGTSRALEVGNALSAADITDAKLLGAIYAEARATKKAEEAAWLADMLVGRALPSELALKLAQDFVASPKDEDLGGKILIQMKNRDAAVVKYLLGEIGRVAKPKIDPMALALGAMELADPAAHRQVFELARPDQDLAVRVGVLDVAKTMKGVDPALSDELFAYAAEAGPEVRRRAIAALWRLRQMDLRVQQLVFDRLRNDPEPSVRSEVADQLALSIKNPEIRKALQDALAAEKSEAVIRSLKGGLGLN